MKQEEFRIEYAVLMGWPKKWWSGKCPQELLKHKEGSLDEPRRLASQYSVFPVFRDCIQNVTLSVKSPG